MSLNLSDLGRAVGALASPLHHGVEVVHQTVDPGNAPSDATAHTAVLAAGEMLQALQRETPRLMARLARHNDPAEPLDLDHARRAAAGADARGFDLLLPPDRS